MFAEYRRDLSGAWWHLTGTNRDQLTLFGGPNPPDVDRWNERSLVMLAEAVENARLND